MQKYTLSELSTEEQESFAKDFEKFLDDHSVYFEPVPTFNRADLNSPWQIQCSVVIQKKTPIEEPITEVIPTETTVEEAQAIAD